MVKHVTKTKTALSSLGLLETIFVVILVMKLLPGTEVNHWSWWIILSPVWVPFTINLMYQLIVVPGQKHK